MARKRRTLGPEDRELWERVQASANPLHPKRPALPKGGEGQRPKSKRTSPAPAQAQAVPIQPFHIGEKGDPFAPVPVRIKGGQSSPVDRRAVQAMRRGRLRPEARIDLHGMTQAQALPALTGFIMRALADDRRMVLVITGKGRDRDEAGPIPVRRGVLRHNVPGWLRAGPMAAQVLDVLPAHQSHGGEGAFYVYLRRRR